MIIRSKDENWFIHTWQDCKENPMHEAALITYAMETWGWSHFRIGVLVGLSEDDIAKRATLTTLLEAELRVLTDLGILSLDEAYDIVTSEPDRQVHIYRSTVERWRNRPHS